VTAKESRSRRDRDALKGRTRNKQKHRVASIEGQLTEDAE